MVTECVLYSSLQFFLNKDSLKPVPVAARSKAWVYGCSSAEIVGSNPAEGMDVSLLCCLLSGVPPSVVCLSVI